MSNEPRPGQTPSRNVLYSYAASFAREAVDVLVEQMRHGDNSNARTGAAKTLLAKAIPDLRAMEISGKEGKDIRFIVIPSETVEKYAISSNSVDSSEGQDTSQSS